MATNGFFEIGSITKVFYYPSAAGKWWNHNGSETGRSDREIPSTPGESLPRVMEKEITLLDLATPKVPVLPAAAQRQFGWALAALNAPREFRMRITRPKKLYEFLSQLQTHSRYRFKIPSIQISGMGLLGTCAGRWQAKTNYEALVPSTRICDPMKDETARADHPFA